ncbi:MAG: ROK family protein [Candidatus Limnocylindrales bacterium]
MTAGAVGCPGPMAAGPILALDLGASRIRAAVVRPDGSIAARAEGPTRIGDGPVAVVADAVALLAAVRSVAASADVGGIVAVGISAPGPVDPVGGLLLEPPNLGPAFRDLPLAAPLGSAMRLPAVLERDTNVALLGEHAFGAAMGVRHALYLTVSTGIGGAVLVDGRLLAGSGGLGGELGHVVVDLDGPPCGCGARGHLEAYSSGVGIARAARDAIDRGGAPGLSDLARRSGARPITARDVAEAEERGDPDAAAIMELARRAFAAALVGMVDVFAPEIVVVGGSIAAAQGERLLGPARDAVRATAFRTAASRVRIVAAALGDDVGLIGALALVRARSRAA